jgi:hypothetical protein
MRGKKWMGLVGLCLGVSLLLVACGDEFSQEEVPGTLPATRLNLEECHKTAALLTSLAEQDVASPVATTNLTSGIAPELLIRTKSYLSNTFPYKLVVPLEWEVREGQAQNNIKGDLFVIKKGAKSGAYITVIAEKLNGAEDGKAFFENKLKEALTAQKFEFERQAERQIGGVTAYGLSYNLPEGQPFAYPVQFVQELFVAQGWGWAISFTASPNYAGQYCPYFAWALDSFTLTGLEK